MSENLLTLFPQKRIRPFDGMSVTADVWEVAHEYHRQAQQSHNLFFHGAGILAGLEVVASDPPDRLVYILPGVVVDTIGRVIVLAEPVAYDLGTEGEGLMVLSISHREIIPPAGDDSQGSDPRFVQDEFAITARSSAPEATAIELARVRRESRAAPVQDARDTACPGVNEIDLRYRRILRVAAEQTMSAAVVYLGKAAEKIQGRGLARLSSEVGQGGRYRLVVDDDVQLDPGVLGYSFICLVGGEKAGLSAVQVKGLQGYLERGGTLLVETGEGNRQTFVDLAAQIGVTLAPLAGDHPLLTQPHLFSAPPSGYERDVEVLVGDGFVLSNANYGGLWNGKAKDHDPARGEIRAAMEWGENLLAYVAERRQRAQTG